MVYDLTYRSAFSCQHFFLSSQLDQKAIFDSFHWLTELPPKALWLSVPPFFVFLFFCFVSYFSCHSVLVSLRSFSARLSAVAFQAFFVLTGFSASSLRRDSCPASASQCSQHRHELLCSSTFLSPKALKLSSDTKSHILWMSSSSQNFASWTHRILHPEFSVHLYLPSFLCWHNSSLR